MLTPSIGLLVVDKPGGITSRDAVDGCQRWFPRGTVLGHTGTLDPLATGVLVICIGRATRLAEYVQRMPKTYRAEFRLGASSDTDDADGTVTAHRVDVVPNPDAVAAAMQGFVGEIDQVPPAYSAAKVTGQRAYALARLGRAADLAPRRIHVHLIEILAFDYPRLDVLVHCGKGTYIRSLARDLGVSLGCGAYVESLRRTRVGPFDAADALSLEADAETAAARVLPLSAAVVDLPAVTLEPADALRLRQGQRVALTDHQRANLPSGTEAIAVFDGGNSLAAVAHLDPEQTALIPDKVFPT